MFKIGDVVIYGAQGICKICNIETKQLGKISADYFVLKPIYNDSTSLFVPIKNEALASKMKPVLTLDQTNALIEMAPKAEIIEIQDYAQKREEYKNILAENNREKLVSLIKTIRLEKEARRQINKKLNINDEQVLRKAEILLFDELGFVLNIKPQEVENIIKI